MTLPTKPAPDPRIAAYIEEIERWNLYSPAPSTSHITLANLWATHGKDVIQNLIKEYFDATSL